MAEYTKKTGGGGAWAKASEIRSGTRLRFVTEVAPQPSEYGEQNVGKARFEGMPDVLNVRVNGRSINGLVDAFGKDSREWVGKTLTAHIEPETVSGRRVQVMTLIPEGYELGADEGGYLVVRPATTAAAAMGVATSGPAGAPTPARDPLAEEFNPVAPDDDINPEDIPF